MKKNIFKDKVFIRILAAIISIVIVIMGFFAIRDLISKIRKESGIKIGDTEISYSNIKKIQSQVSEYKKHNPNAAIDDEFARDTLIMNAALKNYAQNDCKIGLLSSEDIYKHLNPNSKPTDESIKDSLGNKEDFFYLTQENAVYKQKMKDCLIKNRQVFIVNVSFDTPYMDSKTNDEANAKYLEARNKLEPFLEMFKQRKTKEEISSKADMDIINNPTAKDFDFSRFERESVVATAMINISYDGGTEGFATNSVDKLGSFSKRVDMNEVVNGLKKGEHSDIFIASSGIMGIARVEDENSAKFNSWDELLKSIKTKNKVASIIDDNIFGNRASALEWHNELCFTWSNDANGLSYTCQSMGGGHMIHKPGFYMNNTVTRGDVGRHLKALRIRFWDGAVGGIPVNGVKIEGHARGVYTRDTSSYIKYNGLFGNKAIANTLTGHGFAFALADCNGGPDVKVRITGVPNGYRYTGGDFTRTIANGNFTGITNEDISLQKNISPPADRRDSPNAILSSRSFISSSQNNKNFIESGNITVSVGEEVRYRHEVFGSANSQYSNFYLNWNTKSNISGRNKSRNNINIGGKVANGLLVRQGVDPSVSMKNNTPDTTIKVTNSFLGKRYCENISARLDLDKYYMKGVVRNNKQAYDRIREGRVNNYRATQSSNACFYVPYEYELTPCVAGGGVECGGTDIPGEPGGKITVTPKIKNGDKGTDSQPNTKWRVTTWKVGGKDETIPTPNSDSKDETGLDSCEVYKRQFGGKITDCNNKKNGTGQYKAKTTTEISKEEIKIPANAEIGARYCVAISVSPYQLKPNEAASTQNAKAGKQWRHSAPICVLVTKKPKMQIWGNGVYARGGINTSQTAYEGKGTFGSWVEYEAIAGKLITGFTSEASNGSSLTNNLTFRNGSGDKGKWGDWNGASDSSVIVNNINSRFPKTDRARGILVEEGVSNYSGWNGASSSNANINTHIIKAPSNAIISGNIISKNPTGSSGVKSFQQTIMIVNGDLYIHKDVTQIDAWLIVKGKIVTCADSMRENKDIVTETNCGKSLRINGPVISNSLKSWRTGNSTFDKPNVSSEVYNQRADVYLWAYGQGANGGKVVTTYTKELPIRY